MASQLIGCECVDLKSKLYQLEFWGTTLADCVPPRGMVMSGGSKAIITNGGGVNHYIYNSSSNSWKEDLYGIVSAEI